MKLEGQSFYPSNNRILKFDVNKDVDEIRFNHYIMQKENLQRMKYDLPRGQFYMSVRNVNKDLTIAFSKAQRLIKKFIKLGIITNVYTPPKGCKNPSIWQYNSAQKIDTDGDTDSDTVSDTEKHSNINGLTNANDTVSDTHNDTVSDTSKKEYIKRINKNKYSAQAEELWKLYPLKKNKSRALSKIPKLIEKYGFEQMKNTITRYKKYVEDTRENGFKDLKYQNGSTFFNGTYIDYLDKNYGQDENTESNVQMFNFDD